MNKVLIFSKVFKEVDLPYYKILLDKLKACGVEIHICDHIVRDSAFKFEGVTVHPKGKRIQHDCFDFIFSLGGDGTILQAVTLVRNAQIPIVGINLGRLGFLATIEKNRIEEAIDMIRAQAYRVEKRSMLCLTTNKGLFNGINFALNDFTLHKRDTSSMMIVHCYLNGDFVNSYWSDGLVVSTPSGSTGYSLSCGGPIVFPGSSNFIVTPVAPHNLNVRPLVVSDNNKLSFKIDGRSKNYMCTLDSRSEIITSDIELEVSKNDFSAHIVSLDDITFIQTIRKKLNWGIDSRN